MKFSLSRSTTGLLIAGAISLTTISGAAQAHSAVDYSIPAKLLLLNAFLEPLHHHGRSHHIVRPHRPGLHRHGRHHHKSRGHHHKPRRYSHSRGGYRDDRRIKRRYRD